MKPHPNADSWDLTTYITHGVERGLAMTQTRHAMTWEEWEIAEPDLIIGLTDEQLIDIAAGGVGRHFGGRVDRSGETATVTVYTD